MKLSDYTTETGFLSHIKCESVETAVTLLVDELANTCDIPQKADLIAEVMLREQDGSTAVGSGLVIPHTRSQGVKEVYVVVATLAEPLDIPSEDGLPVDIVILLVGPDSDPRPMLRVLARLAHLVKHGPFLDSLRAANSPQELSAAFSAAG